MSLRSECDRAAREPGVWPDSTEVQVVQVGVDDCDSWFLVRSGGTVSWVAGTYLVETQPTAAAPSTGTASTPAPTVAPTTVVPAPTSSPGGPSDAKELLVTSLFKLDNLFQTMKSEGQTLSGVEDWIAKELAMVVYVNGARAVPNIVVENHTLIALAAPSCQLARFEIEVAAQEVAELGQLYLLRYQQRPIFGSGYGDEIDTVEQDYHAAHSASLTVLEGCS